MRENTIKKLIRLVEESDIDVLEVSSWWRKIRITRRLTSGASGNGEGSAVQAAAALKTISMPAPDAAPEAVPATPQTDDEKYVAVKSPMVGTFYAAPAPDAKPYVEPNQVIQKGQVVCIVEAMKLMNEIESELGGRIAKVCVEDAKPVEFGQTLFLIDPSG